MRYKRYEIQDCEYWKAVWHANQEADAGLAAKWWQILANEER